MKLSHGNLVNNPDFADVVFQFKNEKEALYAHEEILNVRASTAMSSLQSMAKVSKKKGMIYVEVHWRMLSCS